MQISASLVVARNTIDVANIKRKTVCYKQYFCVGF